jgi:GNAT superfamily N-acetyltransferase
MIIAAGVTPSPVSFPALSCFAHRCLLCIRIARCFGSHPPTMPRYATLDDLPAMLAIENRCFVTDRLSRRSFRYLLTRGHAAALAAENTGQIQGYVLLLFSHDTSIARLYSIAVHPDHAQRSVGDCLLEAAEAVAMERDCVPMRGWKCAATIHLHSACSAAMAIASSRKCLITMKITWRRCASKKTAGSASGSRSGQDNLLYP